MSDTRSSSEVDAQIVDDLRIVEQGCVILGAAGARAEFWESFTLLKVGRSAYQAEVERLVLMRSKGAEAKVVSSLTDKLKDIKLQLAPLARQLREFLGKYQSEIVDGMKQDLALVFLMGSAKARASVGRWLEDPLGTQGESTLRLRILARLVDAYRKSLLEARRDNLAPVEKDTTVRSMSRQSVRLKPEFIEDLRRLESCRKYMSGWTPPATWDFYSLLIALSEETRRTLEEIEHLKINGKPGEFAGALYRLRGMLKQVRSQHDPMAGPLRAYFAKLFPSFGSDADELAFAFLISSSQGRYRAKQWLEDPELCRGEASASVNGLRTRALAYLDAVKHFPSKVAAT
ncbi:MAG TPA: hypothetical protein VE981_13855 [Planctomycetota bacterium]|nr:hypothetical protein [Planctomycetota bacterium]